MHYWRVSFDADLVSDKSQYFFVLDDTKLFTYFDYLVEYIFVLFAD